VTSKLDLVQQQMDNQARLVKDEIDWEIMIKLLREMGWAQVSISTPWSDMTGEFIYEIKSWCNTNIVGHYHAGGRTWLFEYQQDAVVFALRWS
jgi:hypothetical protein